MKKWPPTGSGSLLTWLRVVVEYESIVFCGRSRLLLNGRTRHLMVFIDATSVRDPCGAPTLRLMNRRFVVSQSYRHSRKKKVKIDVKSALSSLEFWRCSHSLS